jgi:hypothetical protein
MMAENEQWQKTVDLINAIPDEVLRAFPELLYIKGVLHAGFLLPEPVRLRLPRASIPKPMEVA